MIYYTFITNVFPNARVRKAGLAYSGVRVLPLLAYLEKDQLKLQKEIYNWYSEYIKIWEDKTLSISDRQAKISEIKLKRPVIKI